MFQPAAGVAFIEVREEAQRAKAEKALAGNAGQRGTA